MVLRITFRELRTTVAQCHLCNWTHPRGTLWHRPSLDKGRAPVELGLSYLGVEAVSGKLAAMKYNALCLQKSFLMFTSLVLAGSLAQAGLLYNYSQLALKDLDQMSKIVREKVNESNKTRGDKAIPLKEGVQAVFSRPNEDDLIEKIVGPLKNSLDELDSWDSSVRQLVKEALGALKNPKAFKPVVQVTYVVFLENIISEMKPRARSEFERSILKQIQDAEVKLTSEAKHERVLRMMKETRSPSEIAKDVLQSLQNAEKVEAAEDVKRTVIPTKSKSKTEPAETGSAAVPGVTGEPQVQPVRPK